MKNFFVLSLPRCGTAWLSNFLTWGNSFCFHEGSVGCSSMENMRTKFSAIGKPVVGNSDTAAILYLGGILNEFPDAKLVSIVRPLDEVRASMTAAMMDVTGIEAYVERFSSIIRTVNGFTIEFKHLFSQHGMRSLWEYLEIPDPFPWQRMELLREFRMDDTHRFRMMSPNDVADSTAILQNLIETSRLMPWMHGAELENGTWA